MIRNVIYILSIISIISCNQERDVKTQNLSSKVIEIYQNNELAKFYVQRFNRSQGNWKKYLLDSVKNIELKNSSICIKKYSLPQNCADCYNFYNVIEVYKNENSYAFPIMDNFYYQRGELSRVVLEKSLNKLIELKILDLENKEELNEFIDVLFLEILSYKPVSLEEFIYVQRIYIHKKVEAENAQMDSTNKEVINLIKCSNRSDSILSSVIYSLDTQRQNMRYYVNNDAICKIEVKNNSIIKFEMLNPECFMQRY